MPTSMVSCIRTTFNFIQSFNPLIIIVLGGLGSITGTLAIAFSWQLLLEGVLRLVLPQGFEAWRFVVYPIILLLVMLLRPSGIFGEYEIPFLRRVLPPLPPSLVKRKAEEASQLSGQANPSFMAGPGDGPQPGEATE